MEMGAVMEATGLSFEAIRSLSPAQVSAVIEGVANVRDQRAAVERAAVERAAG